jgi:hypothetical protein
MKTACFIYSDNKKYDKLQECAIKSFKKYHPDIPIFAYTSKNTELSHLKGFPYCKYLFAYEVAKKCNIQKIIILGSDVIICDRLNEFIDNYNFDILTSLDYPYPLEIVAAPICHFKFSFSSDQHVNADVVCFNNINALEEVLNCHKWMLTEYGEQAALNYICNIQNKYTNLIVDGDFKNSNIVYNARAKGNLCAEPNTSPWFKYTSKFQIINNKLYTGVHENISKSKQIKVWHYCDAFGHYNGTEFENKINDWINNGFNLETKNFFSDQCDCGDFFRQKFTI